MLTAILWITLAASTAFLILIASPIRLSVKAAFREDGHDEDKHHTEFSALTYYIHPLVLRLEYSSEYEHTRLVILGFKKSLGGAGQQNTADDATDTNGINTDNADTADNQDTAQDNGINTYDTDDIDTDSINPENTRDNGINTDGTATDDTNTNGIDTENPRDETVNTAAKERPTLLSRIRTRINGIKRNRVYRILRDKPLRAKLFRWLKRSAACALRTVSFERIKLHARVGVGTHNPALLGKIYGYFFAAKSALAIRKRSGVDLAMEPVFTESCFNVDSEATLKTSLSEALWLLTVALGTFPYWRVWRTLRKKK